METGLGCAAAVRVLLVLSLLAPAQSKTAASTPGKDHRRKMTKDQDLMTRSNSTHKNCEKLNIPLCFETSPYDIVSFPNSFGHHTQDKARKVLQVYKPLLAYPRCSKVLRPLLCHALAPPCAGGPSQPCRADCQKATAACSVAMKKERMAWPDELICHKLPKCNSTDGIFSGHSALMVGAPASETSDVPKKHTTSKSSKHKALEGKSLGNKTSNQNPGESSNGIHKKNNTKSRNIGDNINDDTSETVDIDDEVTSSIKKPAKKKSDKKGKVMKKGKDDSHLKLKPRRYDIMEMGDPALFQGWADVQGQGAPNDYCRVVGRSPRQRFLACALAGSTEHVHTYVSTRGLDVGHRGTWFMRDMDEDGLDDYCRCVGRGIHSKLSCMKAGPHGFDGSPGQRGSQYSFTVHTSGPCVNKQVNPVLGMYP